VASFDECIEAINSFDDLVNFIRKDPVYTLIYLMCSENEWLENLKYTNFATNIPIKLPTYQRDFDFEKVFSTEDKGDVLNEYHFSDSSTVFTSLTSDKRAKRHEYDLFFSDESVPLPIIFHIFRRKYMRLGYTSTFHNTIHRDSYNLACFIMYAWYVDDRKIISAILELDARLECLTLVPGNLPHIIKRDLCFPSIKVADRITKSILPVALGEFARNDVSERMLIDSQFLNMCYSSNLPLTMKHLNYGFRKIQKGDKEFDHIDPSDVDLLPAKENYYDYFSLKKIRMSPYLFHFAIAFSRDFHDLMIEKAERHVFAKRQWQKLVNSSTDSIKSSGDSWRNEAPIKSNW